MNPIKSLYNVSRSSRISRRRLHRRSLLDLSGKMLTQFTLYLLLLVLLVIILIAKSHGNPNEPPSPFKLPIIGHLHLLAGYEVPYQAFSKLSRKLGRVFSLQMGFVKCVVVNGQKGIREALVTKGHHFDSRPNFERYQQLFCGDKENSLAFCDWSNTQKARRDMLKTYTFPRAFTNKFNNLQELISAGSEFFQSSIKNDQPIAIKPLILRTCANIFTQHFCTKTFGSQSDFLEMIQNFDEIFYEVNQGYAADFLPFLLPLHKKNLQRIKALTNKIREFVLQQIIADRFENFDPDSDPGDYVESLIKSVKVDEKLPWDSALFALEDIIGGHSAVGNFLVKLLAFVAKNPQVQTRLQEETGREPTVMSGKSNFPYVEATVYEAIRLIASPVVPRVANRNSSIQGYNIEKGTVIFLNNYDLSMSEELWEEPEKFMPERFIRDGRLFKPDYFLPFGGGRRSCMGYKLVLLISFGMLANLMAEFTILPEGEEKVPVGSLALPKDTFRFRFLRR